MKGRLISQLRMKRPTDSGSAGFILRLPIKPWGNWWSMHKAATLWVQLFVQIGIDMVDSHLYSCPEVVIDRVISFFPTVVVKNSCIGKIRPSIAVFVEISRTKGTRP